MRCVACDVCRVKCDGTSRPVPFVNIFQEVSADDGVQIRIHVVEDKVYIQVIARLHNVQQRDHVWVAGKLLRKSHTQTNGWSVVGGPGDTHRLAGTQSFGGPERNKQIGRPASRPAGRAALQAVPHLPADT